MNAAQKIFYGYLQKRKTPASTFDMAKYFGRDPDYIAFVLRPLVEAGLVKREKHPQRKRLVSRLSLAYHYEAVEKILPKKPNAKAKDALQYHDPFGMARKT